MDDLTVLDELDAAWLSEERLDEVVAWVKEAMRGYFAAGCAREALAARVDALLSMMRTWLVELGEVARDTAALRKEDAVAIDLDEADLAEIDRGERTAAAAVRLVARLDEARAAR